MSGATIPANRLPPDCPVPVQLTVSLASADAKARRAFRYGVVAGAFLVTILRPLLEALT